MTDRKKSISNPFSTGGGGTSFEQLVGATYLVSLLAGDITRGLDGGITKEVKFQQSWSGCDLDDIVVTASDRSAQRNLALQIKHRLTFSESNEMFCDVIRDCWNIFSDSSEWEFNKAIDRIGIGLGIFNQRFDHFRHVLEIARNSKDSKEFFQKAEIPGFISVEKREFIETMRNVLEKCKGSKLFDDELWQFFGCFVIMHFDLESAGSRDSVVNWNRLNDLLKKRDEAQAKQLFNTLTQLSADYARNAGTVDLEKLKTEIGNSILLKDHQDFCLDLKRLRSHSDKVLLAIRDTIGNNFQLPRLELVNQLEKKLTEIDLVALVGEPMVGKSVILKFLANRLRLEGEVIVFEVERFFGSTIEAFLHGLNIQNELQDILFAAGTAPLRCVLIDGLEAVMGNDDKRRILNDIIREVNNYNKRVKSNGGNRENNWKIVFTCREWEFQNILPHLEIRENIDDKNFALLKIESFTKDEVNEVANHIPRLQSLILKSHLSKILSRPLILDILTLPDVSSILNDKPSKLTETMLIEWYWRVIVRLDENSRKGRGHPDEREQILFTIAIETLKGSKHLPIQPDMDQDAITGLVSDRVLIREGNKLFFSHDTIRDWALSVILKNENSSSIHFLIKNQQPILLTMAFRLFALRILEVEQEPGSWIDLLNILESEEELSPRWHQVALTSFLFSDCLDEILIKLKPFLFSNNKLLEKTLKALRTYCTAPAPGFSALLETIDIPLSSREILLSYNKIPIQKLWKPIIDLILKNFNKLDNNSLTEFSFIVIEWLKKTGKNQPFRKKLAELSLEFINSRLTDLDYIRSVDSELISKMSTNFLKAALWAVDVIPAEIEHFVRSCILDGEWHSYSSSVEAFILKDDGYQVCKYLPQTAVKIFAKLFCKKLDESSFHNSHALDRLGITYNPALWFPPTYLKGPFLLLLNNNPRYGIKLVHKLVNHATGYWRKRMKLWFNRTPIKHKIYLRTGTVEVYGDENVYYWYRYPGNAPNAVCCALMALEYWMDGQIKGKSDPDKLYANVLKDANSAAVVGVCASVALANYQACMESILPIIENPIFLEMDIERYNRDIAAENQICLFSGYAQQWELDSKLLLENAKRPHRKLELNSFVASILFSGSKNLIKKMQKAVRSFAESPPFFFEEDKMDEQIVAERIEKFKVWSTWAEKENYGPVKSGDSNQTEIRFIMPPELEKKSKEKTQSVFKNVIFNWFQAWAINFLNIGEIGQVFTIESALDYAKEQLKGIDFNNIAGLPEEPSEHRLNGIIAFVSALVIHKWEWVKKEKHISWCKELLIFAANIPETYIFPNDEHSKNEMNFLRSAARVLPQLYREFPKDKKVRESILTLARSKTFEVQEFLFRSLKNLWGEHESIIWECVRIALMSARKKAIEGKLIHLKKEPEFNIDWGKYPLLKRLSTYLKTRVLSLFPKIYSKPIERCTDDDLNATRLQSILHCIPINKQIEKIKSSERLINYIEVLLSFTLNNFFHYSRNKYHNEWTYKEWNRLFFQIIGNLILRSPEPDIERRLLNPILENWEKEPSIMEIFLRYLLLQKIVPDIEDRFIKIWLKVGEEALSSKYCNIRNNTFIDDKKIKMLGLLIFTDYEGDLKGNITEWKPLIKFTGFIYKWCNTVGHHPDCFICLVTLLRSIGFYLMPEYGIDWLHICISKAKDFNDLIKNDSRASILAELLQNTWIKYNDYLKNNDTMHKFVFVLDKLAAKGEPLAINLQGKITKNYSTTL